MPAISILNWRTAPDVSADMFFEPFDVKAVNAVWDHLVGIFNDSTSRLSMHGGFRVPDNYSTGAQFDILWTANSSTGVVAWDIDYRSVTPGSTESLDQSGNDASVNVDSTAPVAPFVPREPTISLSSTHFAANDLVQYSLHRDGTDAADTMAAPSILFDLRFNYST